MMSNSNNAKAWVTAALAALLLPIIAPAARAREGRPAVPFLHVTDLYRPHVDPDDHWDLACVFALAHRGAIDLRGIVIDYPPAGRKDCNPDISAVAQMNRITGLSVPVAVGSPQPMKAHDDPQPPATPSEHQAVKLILDTLRTSDRPVLITVTGSSRDVAIAGRQAPDLFARKCAAVYLNAGTSAPDGKPPARLEYNVTLDKAAYAAMFDLPCPVCWLPCFEGTESAGGPVVRPYASHYVFRQSEILPHLAAPVRNYFACMFARRMDSDWLGYLTRAPEEALLTEHGAKDRHMWCTAGLFHAAGYTITAKGQIVQRDGENDRGVFSFEPIQITSGEDGLTKWQSDTDARNRFIIRVRDVETYALAVTTALKTLLAGFDAR